ncbi:MULTISPECIES: D-cysteine desulfhydrase [Providencia]|uniref:D-cysteine desulfhydrase n=1 Tax=Providencia TaxID=586 RepID=UPI00029C574B|nr:MULTISPECIES: D-cysteine desulfhydrase [Providencia]EHZ7765391.1 D-cysteine desulfhydrase [Providencia rettgeri]EIJ7168533.1 D-cysteine desulfhydrase [Providencia rettgeri]EJD6046591.1 D-cysteine desulfhydrase [Providencia rettgeri]EJD6049449.1 D-cysteine desulfhydrase [Providencia rettgeri]EKT55136.1 D-cysteine desulfhydrase [Providencia rettgeri Dmel1]
MSIRQRLAAINKIDLLRGPTPLAKLNNLSEYLGRDIYIKRDDMTPLAMGGNKLRKLEYIIADAIQKKSKVIVTAGAIQSNHVRQTAAIASMYGLECVALLENPLQSLNSLFLTNGNKQLTDLFNARCYFCDELTDPSLQMQALVESLRLQDAYIVPIGGSNALGSLGYVNCALEVAEQTPKDIEFAAVIVASGSAGTHAGLAMGLQSVFPQTPVIGVTVSRTVAQQQPKVETLQQEIGKLLNLTDFPKVNLWDQYFSPCYGQPNNKGQQAIELLAQKEGILLDPVYTGKAMAGLVDHILKESIDGNQPLLFIHTGGAPAIFAYSEINVATIK